MILQQISVFLENRAGQLAQITGMLAESGVDLRALNIAETADYGVLRLIVSDPQKTMQILQDNGCLATMTTVVAARIPDRPGGLHELLRIMEKENVDINYMYSIFGQKNGMAHMIFRVNEPEYAEKLLEKSGMPSLFGDDLGIDEQEEH